MSSRSGNNRASQASSGQQAPPSTVTGSNRQNEYFVPRDGIDREVITADICRYLGNDALVRPGTYESPDGRITQGYYITAYRNLTSAMIQDLKADSARWDQERRAASQNRNAGGAAGASSRMSGQDYRTSNTFRDRESREIREHYQSAGGAADYGDPMSIDTYGAQGVSRTTYPGTGSSGYNGVNSATYAAQPYATAAQAAQASGYATSPYPGGASYGASTTTDPRYGTAGMDYNQGPYMATAAHYGTNPANFGATGYAQDQRTPAVTAASRTAGYTTAAAAGYPSGGDGYYQQTTGGYSQPIDALYGRGAYNSTVSTAFPATSNPTSSPAGTAPTGYGQVADPSQYDASQPPVPNSARTATSPSAGGSSNTQQLTSSGTTTASRREDRERSDRHRDRERSDRDRDDRHGNSNSTSDRHSSHRHRTRQ